jgi:hypothetical protein
MATSVWKQKSNYNLGTLLLGAEYSISESYVINDVVSFNGATYRAIKDNPAIDGVNVLPKNTTYWEVFDPEIIEGDTFDVLLPINLGAATNIVQTEQFTGASTFTDFDSSSVYVTSVGLPEHPYGPYPNSKNSYPAKVQDYLFTLPRFPIVPTTKTDLPTGAVAVATNGVPIYNHALATKDIIEGEEYTQISQKFIENGAVSNDGSGPPSVIGDYHYRQDPLRLYYKPTLYKGLYDDNRLYEINEIVYYNGSSWVANLEDPGSIISNDFRVIIYGRETKFGRVVDPNSGGFDVETRNDGVLNVAFSNNNTALPIVDRRAVSVNSVLEQDWIQYVTGIQHSPIIGFAFDGNPIYGSLGYSDPMDATSHLEFMTSGYIVRDDKRQDGSDRNGDYEEDWVWQNGVGSLDEYNGRYCVTPEYPTGTYAYFASCEKEAPLTATYPYLLAKQYYGQPILPNGTGEKEGLNDVQFEVISGSLPRGLRIERQRIRGTPLEVSNTTEYNFVIRAKYARGTVVEDRTFRLIVEGPDEPEWLTPEGDLPVGPNNTYYILDGDYVDLNLLATDVDLPAGSSLEFFIDDEGGVLPPGLTLTKEGRIFGFTEPVIPLSVEAVKGGGYDFDRYDFNPYDYAIKSQSGFDSFLYDNVGYDVYDPTRSPKKANRYYEFIVSINDGSTIAKRKFKIFVVGDDAARADNVSSLASQGLFSADMTFVRKPIFITPSNLGVKRAGTFITLIIDVFDPNTLIGPIDYALEPVNLDGSPSVLPDGLSLDIITGEIAGRYPYQPEVTKEFNFTVKATRYNPSVADRETVYGYLEKDFASGDTEVFITSLSQADADAIIGAEVFDPVSNKNVSVVAVAEVDSASYTGWYSEDETYTRVTFSKPLQFAGTFGQVFRFETTVTALDDDEYISERKQFSLKVQGAADGAISWITPSDLGTITANSISTLKLEAESTFPGTTVVYKLISGQIPNGLTLIEDGELIGRVRQFSNETNKGISIFDNGYLTFDGATTTFDRSYTFTVEAKDGFTINAVQRTFTVFVSPLKDKAYSNLYMKPLIKPNIKADWLNFINDSNVFSSDLIYRPYDENFGVQKDLSTLVFAGLEAKPYSDFAAAVAYAHKPRSLRIGGLQSAEARKEGVDEIRYEVVYLELLDPAEKVGNDAEDIVSPNDLLTLPTERNITVDQTNADLTKGPVDANNVTLNNDDPYSFRPDNGALTTDSDVNPNSNNEVYVSTITNMRKRLLEVGDVDNDFLPLWMRTRQDATGRQPGYVRAIPIAYCKPGKSKELLLKINAYLEQSGYSFKEIDYFVDRYLIDATLGNSNPQFIVWPRNDLSI